MKSAPLNSRLLAITAVAVEKLDFQKLPEGSQIHHRFWADFQPKGVSSTRLLNKTVLLAPYPKTGHKRLRYPAICRTWLQMPEKFKNRLLGPTIP